MRSIYILGITSLALTLTACGKQNCNDCCVVDETYVHKYGVAVPSDFWADSGEHGSVISTMGDGIVITRGYSSGLLDGETTYSFPHSSQIQKKEIYNQGTLTKTTEYFFDGTPRIETVTDSPIGTKKISTWYLSGTPKSVEVYSGNLIISGEYYSQNNQRDALVENHSGTRLVRDDYGQLISTDQIEGGQLTLRTNYHPNGAPQAMIPYKDGLVDGTKKTFHPAGEPATVEEWAGGKQHGMTTAYQHGEKYAEVPYVDGQKQGKEVRYRDGNTVVQEIGWEKGDQHGPMTTYIGDTPKSEYYYKGEQTTKADYEFMSNRPMAR